MNFSQDGLKHPKHCFLSLRWWDVRWLEFIAICLLVCWNAVNSNFHYSNKPQPKRPMWRTFLSQARGRHRPFLGRVWRRAHSHLQTEHGQRFSHGLRPLRRPPGLQQRPGHAAGGGVAALQEGEGSVTHRHSPSSSAPRCGWSLMRRLPQQFAQKRSNMLLVHAHRCRSIISSDCFHMFWFL